MVISRLSINQFKRFPLKLYSLLQLIEFNLNQLNNTLIVFSFTGKLNPDTQRLQ